MIRPKGQEDLQAICLGSLPARACGRRHQAQPTCCTISVVLSALFRLTAGSKGAIAGPSIALTVGSCVWSLAPPARNGWSAAGEKHAHAGSQTRVTSMGGLYDAATLHALCHVSRPPSSPKSHVELLGAWPRLSAESTWKARSRRTGPMRNPTSGGSAGGEPARAPRRPPSTNLLLCSRPAFW